MGTAGRRNSVAAVVVDRGSSFPAVCAGVGLTLFCRAQPASFVSASAVVLVRGPENGGVDALRKNARRSSSLHCNPKLGSLLHADREDVFPLDFDFNPERRAKIGTLHDRAAHPYASGKIGHLERIKDRPAARVSNHGILRALNPYSLFSLAKSVMYSSWQFPNGDFCANAQ